MIAVESILSSVQATLQDDGTRWPVAELIGYLDEGQRDVASMRPDMFSTTVAWPLVAGAKQLLPSDCSKLVDVIRNTSGQAIRQADRNILDALDPSWYSKTSSKVIKHFCYDLREQQMFWVYPPASVGASVDVTYSWIPSGTVSINTTYGNGLSSKTSVNVNPIFTNALISFVLYRAYAKDAEGTSNASISASYYQLFKAGVASEEESRKAVQPTPQN